MALPRNIAAARGAAGWGHPALRSPGWLRLSPLAQSIKFIRRDGIYPARGAPRRRKPGRYGIGPYGGAGCAGGCGFPVGRPVFPVP